MDNLEDMKYEELVKLETEIFDEWMISGTVHSLQDYADIIRELTLRETKVE